MSRAKLAKVTKEGGFFPTKEEETGFAALRCFQRVELLIVLKNTTWIEDENEKF